MSSATPSEPVSYAKSRAVGPDGKGQVPEGSPTMGAGGLRRVTSRVGRERPRSARARATVASQQHGLLPYPEYKPSGVERPAEVPEHWEVRRLKYVCRLHYGDTLSSGDRVAHGDVPVYGSNGPIGVHSVANTSAPCVIIGRKGSYGKVAYSEIPTFAIDTTYYVDYRHTDADIRWLYYVLATADLDQVSRDSAIPGLNRTDADNRICLYPPLREQRGIARYLNCETAKIDALIQLLTVSSTHGVVPRTAPDVSVTMFDLLREYRTRLISDVVTGKVDVRAITGVDEETAN